MNEEIDIEEFAPWGAVLITLAGYFLRVLLLDAKGLWVDETFSIWMAHQSIPDILQWAVKIDQHPPLYYLLLHYWVALRGDAPYDVRLLSALFGAGTIPIIYLIGKRMSGAIMGLAAAALLAFSPIHIYFAQETRMYTLLTFNASMAIYALVRLLTDPLSNRPIGSQLREYLRLLRTSERAAPTPERSFSYEDAYRGQTGWRAWMSRHRWPPIHTIETDLAWFGLIVFSAATLLTHNTAVFFPLACNIFVLGLMGAEKWNKAGAQPAFHAPSFRNWIKAQVGIFFLWSPWTVAFLKQARAVNEKFWIPAPTWDAVTQTLKSFVNASAPLPTWHALLVWIPFLLAFCLALLHYRKKISQFLFLVALFFLPILGELVVSIQRPIFLGRTLIWITIPLFLALAAGVAQLRFRFLLIVATGTLAAINLLSVSDYFKFYQKEDWDTPAGYVALFAEEGDLVLFNSNFVEIPFNYYFKRYEDFYSIKVEKLGIPLDLFENGVLEPQMTSNDIPRLISILDGRGRVWLVYSHDSYTDPLGLIPQTLASQMRLVRTREFYGGVVQLYERP